MLFRPSIAALLLLRSNDQVAVRAQGSIGRDVTEYCRRRQYMVGSRDVLVFYLPSLQIDDTLPKYQIDDEPNNGYMI